MAEHESKHTKQKDKTKAYWDTFYSTLPSSGDDANTFATKGDLAQTTKAKEDTAKKEDSSDLEWIVPNSPGLLDTILGLFPPSTSETTDRDARNDSSAINILEIGCSSIHPPLLTPLLNNIHRWLLPGCGSKYIIISPRSKIKSVRDFKGFASVRRTKVDTATLDGNDVVLVKSNNKEAARSKSEVYLYECIKNDKYKPDVDEPYSSMGCNSNSDDETCGKCGLSFKEFRGNVDVLDQGEAVWARRWKNHCAHCKEK